MRPVGPPGHAEPKLGTPRADFGVDPWWRGAQGWPKTVITRVGAYVAPVDVTDDVPSPSESAGGPFNLVLPAGLDMQVRPGVTLGQLAAGFTAGVTLRSVGLAAARQARLLR